MYIFIKSIYKYLGADTLLLKIDQCYCSLPHGWRGWTHWTLFPFVPFAAFCFWACDASEEVLIFLLEHVQTICLKVLHWQQTTNYHSSDECSKLQ